MRKRFWDGSIIYLGSIICLLAAFSILALINQAEGCEPSECDEGVCASARISGAASLKARGVVRSPNNCWGGWGINVRAGSNSDSDSDYYTSGVRESLEVSQHTNQARATSWITGHNAHDESFDAYACDESGG